MKSFIVGLAGPQQVGKDTVAGLLVDSFRNSHTWAAADYLARPLYETVSSLTGLSVAQLQDRRTKETPFVGPGAPRGLSDWTPRRMLEFIGTEVVRTHFGGDLWVNRLLERNRELLASGGVLFISDVRFLDEARICDVVIELERDGITYPNTHASSKRLPAEAITATVNNLINELAVEEIRALIPGVYHG